MPADDSLYLRIPADLKEKIKQAAAADNRTVSNYIINAAIERMNRDAAKNDKTK